jgi:hypothetical protein
MKVNRYEPDTPIGRAEKKQPWMWPKTATKLPMYFLNPELLVNNLAIASNGQSLYRCTPHP